MLRRTEWRPECHDEDGWAKLTLLQCGPDEAPDAWALSSRELHRLRDAEAAHILGSPQAMEWLLGECETQMAEGFLDPESALRMAANLLRRGVECQQCTWFARGLAARRLRAATEAELEARLAMWTLAEE